jgi:hypothetical protein
MWVWLPGRRCALTGGVHGADEVAVQVAVVASSPQHPQGGGLNGDAGPDRVEHHVAGQLRLRLHQRAGGWPGARGCVRSVAVAVAAGTCQELRQAQDLPMVGRRVAVVFVSIPIIRHDKNRSSG